MKMKYFRILAADGGDGQDYRDRCQQRKVQERHVFSKRRKRNRPKKCNTNPLAEQIPQ
jgi:hypothetical protein